MSTTRELIVETLSSDTMLPELGLDGFDIFQADTVDNPSSGPFAVVRWGLEQPGMGPVRRIPFDIWVYDNPGDPTRAGRIVSRMRDVLTALPQTEVENGWLATVEWDGQGADGADDIYKKLFIPGRFTAITSGD